MKSFDSTGWFSECNILLYKYFLPNVHTLGKEIISLKIRKEQLRSAAESQKYLNIGSLRV